MDLIERAANKLKGFLAFSKIRKEWLKAIRASYSTEHKANQTTKKILIFPSDLKTITGALGDDAMITATVEQFKQHFSEAEIFMLCRETATGIVRSKGITPVVLPHLHLYEFPDFISRLYSQFNFDHIVSLGADIMDGYYGFNHPAMVLMASDIAVNKGMHATILGASFNDKPKKMLSYYYNRVDKRVYLNMRDEISLARIQRFTSATAALVADSAFTLKPSEIPASTSKWIEDEKSKGNIVIGINVHPMLIKNATEEEVQSIITTTSQVLVEAGQQQTVSYLFLPHDYRGEHGDGRCLHPIYKIVSRHGELNPSFYLDGEYSAATLKAVAGKLDGVITGRMHLAIASLGMGIPVLCVTYQDKFEGLFKHYDLSSDMLLPPEIFKSPKKLSEAISIFISKLPALKQQIEFKNPSVKTLAMKNFIAFTEDTIH